MVSSDTSNADSGISIQPHVGCVNGRDLIRCTLLLRPPTERETM